MISLKFILITIFHQVAPLSYGCFRGRLEINAELNSAQMMCLFSASYNWVPVKTRLHASSYLVDLLDYLHTTFLNFSTLPVGPSACLLQTFFTLCVKVARVVIFGIGEELCDCHSTAMVAVQRRVIKHTEVEGAGFL